MTILRLTPGALSLSVAVAMLTGCGANAVNVVSAPSTTVNKAGLNEKIFYYTGVEQKFTVPSGVKSIRVDASGGAGAGKLGEGGRVVAVIPVTPNETLYVFVGSHGFIGEGAVGPGGFNGGASGGPATSGNSYGGGGASDLREGGDGVSNRILVAGGGGGGGGPVHQSGSSLHGGFGGLLTGGKGRGGPPGGSRGRGGAGGTQGQGGAGGAGGIGSGKDGAPGDSGRLGAGGVGGQGGFDSSGAGGGSGGGGGGGYFGGGGGGGGGGAYASLGSAVGAGGGGGSSYVESRATDVQMWQGWKHATGNGSIILVWK